MITSEQKAQKCGEWKSYLPYINFKHTEDHLVLPLTMSWLILVGFNLKSTSLIACFVLQVYLVPSSTDSYPYRVHWTLGFPAPLAFCLSPSLRLLVRGILGPPNQKHLLLYSSLFPTPAAALSLSLCHVWVLIRSLVYSCTFVLSP